MNSLSKLKQTKQNKGTTVFSPGRKARIGQISLSFSGGPYFLCAGTNSYTAKA